jgi:WD40 repeat protein
VNLWNVPAGRLRASVPLEHTWGLEFTADSRTLGVFARGRIVLYRLPSCKRIALFPIPWSFYASPVLSPDGKEVAQNGIDSSVVAVGDTITHRTLATLRGHTNHVYSIAFSPDGKLIATGSADRTIKLWDARSGRELRTLRGHSNLVRTVVFSNDGRTLASWGWDHSIMLWDVTPRPQETTRSSMSAPVGVFSGVSPDLRLLVLSPYMSADGRDIFGTTVFDAPSHKLLVHLPERCDTSAFNPDCRLLAMPSYRELKAVTLWDLRTARKLAVFRGHTENVRTLCMSPDGRILATGSADKTIKLWDIATAREIATLRGHDAAIIRVVFSHSGRLLGSMDTDHKLRVWDVASRRQISSAPTGHSNPSFLGFTFSPDDRILASAGGEGVVRLWNPRTGQLVGSLEGHGGFISTLAFSPDGRTLATASGDGTIKLWNVLTGQEVATIPCEPFVAALAFSPSGDTLTAYRTDGAWNLQPFIYRWRAAPFSETDRMVKR